MECQYELMTYGIPTSDLLPVSVSGTVSMKHHHDWIERRRSAEELTKARYANHNTTTSFGSAGKQAITEAPCPTFTSSTEQSTSLCEPNVSANIKTIMIPKHEDILLGRGNLNHYGNLVFRQMIEDHQQEYEVADKASKTCIAESIVQKLHDKGGRFLKRFNEKGSGGKCWVEMSDEEARYKVSHRFRNMRMSDQRHGKAKFKGTKTKCSDQDSSSSTSPEALAKGAKRRERPPTWEEDNTTSACFGLFGSTQAEKRQATFLPLNPRALS